MRDCYQYNKKVRLCIGEKARVMLGEESHVGTLISLGKKITKGMPEFELEDGRRVFGYECWWLPLEVAEKAEKQVKEMGTDEQSGI